MTTREEAEAKLEEAIREFLVFKEHDDGLVLDWVLVTAQHIDRGEDGIFTATGMYVPVHQKIHHTAGLVRYAEFKVARAFTGEEI